LAVWFRRVRTTEGRLQGTFILTASGPCAYGPPTCARAHATELRQITGDGIVVAAPTDYYVGTVNPLDFLSPSHWWTDPTEPLDSPVYLGIAIVLGLVLVAAAFAWIAAPRYFAEHRFRQRQVTRLATIVFSFAAVGLLLLLFRWGQVPFFSKRLWLYLWLLSALGTAIYVGYYLKKVYPRRLATWLDAERRRRYLPKPGSGQQRPRRRARRRR
jgi:hypothetical protein